MLKVGDYVKVISKAEIMKENGVEKEELIPIGTICKVVEVDNNIDDADYRIVDITKNPDSCSEFDGWWYKENELEKGHTEWIKE